MPEITVDLVEEMPESARVGRKGKWTDLIDAALDGKPRALRGIPAEDMEAVRRQLSHTASSRDKGVTTVVKDGVLYFQVGDKRRGPAAGNGSNAAASDGATVAAAGSSTPAAAGASPGGASGSPRRSK